MKEAERLFSVLEGGLCMGIKCEERKFVSRRTYVEFVVLTFNACSVAVTGGFTLKSYAIQLIRDWIPYLGQITVRIQCQFLVLSTRRFPSLLASQNESSRTRKSQQRRCKRGNVVLPQLQSDLSGPISRLFSQMVPGVEGGAPELYQNFPGVKRE